MNWITKLFGNERKQEERTPTTWRIVSYAGSAPLYFEKMQKGNPHFTIFYGKAWMFEHPLKAKELLNEIKPFLSLPFHVEAHYTP